MGATNRESGHQLTDPPHRRVLNALRSSALLSLAAIGVLVIATGYLLDTSLWIVDWIPEREVWAAIFAVWGVGLILVGLSGRVLIWVKRQ